MNLGDACKGCPLPAIPGRPGLHGTQERCDDHPMRSEDCTWPRLTSQLIRGEDLPAASAAWAMDEVMGGGATPVQLAGFLVALAGKGVTSTELGALADAMIGHARPVDLPRRAVDIVGTGGDLANTVNISTMAAVIVAASGRAVFKHGNRASTSKSGTADVLEALGVRVDLPVASTESLARELGIAFLFAQVYHPSMRFAVDARKGLGVPTVFNVLGPITNPARPRASAVGVADPVMAPTVAGVFAGRGTSALVFRGQDGLDELTVGACSDIWEVRAGTVASHVLDPRELLGIPRAPVDALRGGTALENAGSARELFAGGGREAVRDAVLLNAAAGILAFDGIEEGSAPSDSSSGAEHEAAAGVRAGTAPSGDRPFEERFTAAFEEAARTLESGDPERLLARWAERSAAGATD